MRKFKFIVCSVAAVLVLTGCQKGNKNDPTPGPQPEPELPAGELPEGGTALDITTEEGKQALYNEVMAVIDAYTAPEQEFTAIGLKSETKNVNVDATAKVEAEDMTVLDAEAHIKDFGITIDAKVGGDDESWAAEAGLDINGLISAKGFMIMDEGKKLKLDDQLNFDHVGAQAWLTNDNVYVNADGEGLRDLLEQAKPIVAKILPYVMEGIPAGTVLDLNAILDSMCGEDRHFYIPLDGATEKFNPIALINVLDIDEEDKPTAEDWAEVQEVLEQIPFLSFQTYADGRFGIALDINMEQFLAFAEAMDLELEEEIFDMIPEANLKVAVMIRANGLLDSISIAADAKVDIQIEDDVLANIQGSASLEEVLTLTYNDEVSFNIPSDEVLAEYVEFDPDALGM